MKMKFFEKTGPGARRTALILILVVLLTVGCVTTAFALRDTTGEVTESLEKAEVTCEVNENWSVTNTGNIPALIRVRVIVNLTDDDTLLPGDVPDYTVGSGWVKIGDYLYYTGIVDFEEGENGTGNVTTPAISYSNTGAQTTKVTVLADAIQATPSTATQQAWRVTFENGNWS